MQPIDEHYKKLSDSNVVIAFKGEITGELINEVLDSIESKLLDLESKSRIRKKIYNILVESLQNIYHHIDDSPEGDSNDFNSKFALVVVSHDDVSYKVTSGNFVNRRNVPSLKDKIDKINSMTPDEMKDMYKFILNHQKLSSKGGGGLGLLDIARKSGSKIEYSFDEVNENYYFFNMNVQIIDKNL